MTSRLSLVLLCGSLACSHAKTADDASGQEPAKEQAAKEGEASQDEDPERAAAEEQVPDPQAVGGRKGLIAGGEKDPQRVPVASSPTGLLKPGAEENVRAKLGVTGKGEALRPALKKFQREHDLPATGILDHRTAEKLGLDPEDLFERAEH